MKLVIPHYEIIKQEPGIDGIYKQIEIAGRTCYKSENKITEDSAKKFVDTMIKSGHCAMLEHGTVYLRMSTDNYDTLEHFYEHISKYRNNPYSRVVIKNSESYKLFRDYAYITTNFRVLYENNLLDDLNFICKPTEYHEKRHTVRFICDRCISHQLVRHRVFSFAQESQRYCNYSKDQYDNEVSFIMPVWFPDVSMHEQEIFMDTCHRSEESYLKQLELGQSPEQARTLLLNAVKTEVVMTGFENDWKKFFDERTIGTTGRPYPEMKALTRPLMQELLS